MFAICAERIDIGKNLFVDKHGILGLVGISGSVRSDAGADQGIGVVVLVFVVVIDADAAA